MNIQQYHGEVSRCHCTNYDSTRPMPCNDCFCRGYTAQCLHCMGTGQITEGVAGSHGTMKSTCAVCGGKGKFGVNKPANFEEMQAAKELLKHSAAEAPDEGRNSVDKAPEPSEEDAPKEVQLV